MTVKKAFRFEESPDGLAGVIHEDYKYPVSRPDIGETELKMVTEAVKSGWVSSKGAYIDAFQEKFAFLHKAKHGVACSSGTNALVLALRAIGVKEGDEVIVPEFTMIATAWAVSMCGAKPVFVDCGNDLNINPRKIAEKITPKTKAIIPVHVYGRVCDMSQIMKIAHDYGLRVIEDSCEAHSIQLSGDIACYSFYANKIITTGEGGMSITNDPYLASQMEHLRSMAFSEDHDFLHAKFAYNFRMTNMQAALGLAQLNRMDGFLKKRAQIAEWYDENLKELADGKRFRIMPPRAVVWMYDIQVAMPDREPLLHWLKEHGVEARRWFKPMSQQPMYQGDYFTTFAFKLSMEGLYLPTYTQLTEEDVRSICDVVKGYYREKDARAKEKESLPGEGSKNPPGAPVA